MLEGQRQREDGEQRKRPMVTGTGGSIRSLGPILYLQLPDPPHYTQLFERQRARHAGILVRIFLQCTTRHQCVYVDGKAWLCSQDVYAIGPPIVHSLRPRFLDLTFPHKYFR